MITNRVLCVLFAFVALLMGCGVCTGEPRITLIESDRVTVENYPYAGLQTTFSIGKSPDTMYATIYVSETPQDENRFSLDAQLYIIKILGKDLSNTLGGFFEDRKIIHVEVIGVYANEILIVSRNFGELKAPLEKYNPSAMEYGSLLIDALPPQLAQHLQYTPTMALPNTTKTPTPVQTPTPRQTKAPFSLPPCSCTVNLYNCDDFKSQGDAQVCYEYCLSQGRGDIHKLDEEEIGQACESYGY